MLDEEGEKRRNKGWKKLNKLRVGQLKNNGRGVRVCERVCVCVWVGVPTPRCSLLYLRAQCARARRCKPCLTSVRLLRLLQALLANNTLYPHCTQAGSAHPLKCAQISFSSWIILISVSFGCLTAVDCPSGANRRELKTKMKIKWH